MKMTENHSSTIMSFKKDRSVEITSLSQSHCINEEGVEEQTHEIVEGKLRDDLKTIIEREFLISLKVTFTIRSRSP